MRRGEYTTPEKTPHLPPHDKDDDNHNGWEGIAVGASLNYDEDSISVDYKEGINDEDDDYQRRQPQ